MCWELQCNYKPILWVKGIKATRVTGSTTELDSDKETQKEKNRGERERKRRRRRRRAAFER